MLRARASWDRFSKRLNHLQTRSFCSKSTTTTSKNGNNSIGNGGDKVESNLISYDEAYKQLDNLDFMTASKILFSDSPKKRKFGIDFHLVQLFFVCMPSLAVYLVAQYARYDMRKMEADLELKKKKEEEKKAEEMKLLDETKEKNPELQEVKTRLDKLEETLKAITVESQKQSGITKYSESEKSQNDKCKHETINRTSNMENMSSKYVEDDQFTKKAESAPVFPSVNASGSKPASETPRKDGNKDQNNSELASPDAKR